MSITLKEAWCKVNEWCQNPPWDVEGTPGPPGPPGPQGEQGIQGIPGNDGADGQDGTDGVSPTVTVTKEERCKLISWLNVNADGTVSSQCGDGTVTRTAVGTYTTIPPAGAETISLDVIEAINTRDSIEIHSTDFVGTIIHISEGDNGTAANILRDRDFIIKWYGREDCVTDVTVT